jgi:anti-sigma B factor antagonist
MRIKVKMLEDVAVLVLSGKLGYTEMASSLHKKVKGFIRNGVKNIIFNMEDVDLITSNGLGILMACQTSVMNAEGQLKLIHPNDGVIQFLYITGLDGYFQIYETEKEALEHF